MKPKETIETIGYEHRYRASFGGRVATYISIDERDEVDFKHDYLLEQGFSDIVFIYSKELVYRDDSKT